MDENSLKNFENEAKIAIKNAADKNGLEAVVLRYIGKNGLLAKIFSGMGALPAQERQVMGVAANVAKQAIAAAAEEKRSQLGGGADKKTENFFDPTLPAVTPHIGHLHPLTITINKICSIFQNMGFEVVDSPEAENEWYGLDALNIPKEHPARDSFDTLFLDDGRLLRPHTSPGQIHYMEKNQPPLRIVVPGRCFRRDAIDASHEINFHQIEGLIVDKDISVANFKAVIEEFFRQFFADSESDSQRMNCKVRLRPSFFPFTEPSFEVDLFCVNCQGNGCSACKQSGWMEIMGAGMVHPNVFSNAGIDASKWQGFAFGMGIERLAMIKYKINDIRLFYDGGTRFLQQF